jgi:two-component system response regulator HydG
MTRAPVLITGETGTGKDVVARLLHRLCCPEGPFVSVNCTAVPSGLIESELFGCVPGAFNEAVLRRGAFEAAAQGILFLDEITEVSLSFQVKLNRVIEYDEFTPVGGDPVRSKKQFVGRVVAATMHDPATAMAQGKLRSDLFHRFPHVVTVPPLRERLEDVPLLTDHFLEQATRMRGARRPSIEVEDVRRLLAHSWPGNVRELRNVIENFVLSGALPPLGDAAVGSQAAQLADLGALPYAEAKRIAIRRFQEAYVWPIVKACHGDVRAAAERIQVGHAYLKELLAELENSARSDETPIGPSRPPESSASPTR